MDRDRMKRAAVIAMVFCAPVVMVKVAGIAMGGGGPSEAAASEPATATKAPAVSIEMDRKHARTPTKDRASMRLEELRGLPLGESPWYYPPRLVVEEGMNAVVETRPRDALAATVTSIMASPRGNIAIINGRARRIGDFIGDWMIDRISPEDFTVGLLSVTTGERRTLRLNVGGGGE